MDRPSKAFILAEIQRCAEANGGTPLGRDRFEAVTGLRDRDWRGKYWARWGDAVREAGLEPNNFQGQGYSDDGLLREFALVTRDYGRWPTTAELRMWRLQHPEFPDQKVFNNRFGTQPKVIARLAEFTSRNDDLADVYTIVAPLVSGSVPAAQSQVQIGYVYLLKSGKYYKIGRSNSVDRRERELSIQLPQKVDRVHAIETDDPPGIEHYWHRRFREQRVRPDAEWFVLSAEQVAAFKRRKFQ